VRSELANTTWERDPLDAPVFLKRYRSGARQREICERGAQALIDDGSLAVIKDGDGIVRAAFTERGLRRLAHSSTDTPSRRRGELARLLKRAI
jgi:hypothetical protein